MKNDSRIFTILALLLVLGAGVAVYLVYFRDAAAPEVRRGNAEGGTGTTAEGGLKVSPREFAPEAAGRTDPVATTKPEQPATFDKAVRRMIVSGRVLDERGAALNDIRVEFQGTGDLAMFRGAGYTDLGGNYTLLAWERTNMRRAQSNETGGFVFAKAPDGRMAAGEVQAFAFAALTNMVDIVLRVQAGIEGSVQDADGAPAPFAQVTLRSMGTVRIVDESGGAATYDHRQVVRTMTADERGRFSFPNLPFGQYGLTVDGGYFGGAQAYSLCDANEGKVYWQDLKLTRLNFVRGTLRDQDGVPIEGAVVVLRQVEALKTPDGDVVNTNGDDVKARISGKREGERGRDFRAAKTRWKNMTDAEGRFGFHNIPDVEHDLLAQLGAKNVEIKGVRVNQGDYSLTLTLENCITGTVRDAATNMPVARYDIRAYGGDAEPTPFDKVNEDALFPWHSEGRFRILNSAATSVSLRVSAPGYAPAVLVVKDLKPSERRSGADVALKPLCNAVLTLKQGEKLLPREPVMVLYDGRSIAEGATDDFGEVRLPGLVPAEYELRVLRADGSTLKARLAVPAQHELRQAVACAP